MYLSILGRIHRSPILKASLVIGVITILIRMAGYVEKVLLAYYLGTSYEIDAYTLVISIIMSVFVFFRELIEPGFLNVFLRALNQNNTQGAWAFFNKVGRFLVVVTLVLSVVAFFYSGEIIGFLAPGFHGPKKELATDLFSFGFPATIFLSLSALTNIALNGQKSFILPAFGDLALKLTVLAALVLGFRHYNIYAVIYGFLLGAILKLIIHCIPLSKNISFKKVKHHAGFFREAWKLTWPLLIGVGFSQFSDLFDNLFASYMKEGSLAALSYSKKLIELPVLLFPYILSVVIFPYFSELAITKENSRLSELLMQSLAWIILCFIPMAVFYHMFSYDLVAVLLERGAFDRHSTAITAYPLAIYSYGLVFFAIETVLVIFYFANSNTRTPILIGVLSVVENIILTYILINTMGYSGIAVSLVISKVTKVVILLILLKQKYHIDLKPLIHFTLKVIVSASILPIVFTFLYHPLLVLLPAGAIGRLILLGGLSAIGAGGYFSLLWLIKLDRSLLFNASA